MKVKIRFMTREDKPAIMAILNNTPEFKPAEVVVAEELLDSYLHDPNGWGYYILVAEAEEKVAGYICYGPTLLTEGTWDIYWIAVAAEKQNQGVGCALMSSAEANIGRAKGRLVLVETSSKPNYGKTRRFYQKLGYEVVSRIPDFYEPGDDKITLQKLSPR